MYRIALVAALGVMLVLLGFSPVIPKAEAQGGARGLTVSPLTFELSANPGDKLKHTIKVDNPTDQTLSLVAEPRNFVALGEEGQPQLVEEETTYSLASWITIEPTERTVPPKGAVTFDFHINPPLNAEPGGHFGSIIIKTRPQAEQGGQVAIVQEVGALVLLRIAGEAKEEGRIESFKATDNFQEYGPVNFELRVRNQGNVHFKPISAITITNMFGREVDRLQFEQRNVLPDSVRRFETNWNKKWLFGKYTASLTMVYGSQNQILNDQTTFYVFPYKVGGVVLVVLAVVGILLYRGRDRLRRSFRILFGKD